MVPIPWVEHADAKVPSKCPESTGVNSAHSDNVPEHGTDWAQKASDAVESAGDVIRDTTDGEWVTLPTHTVIEDGDQYFTQGKWEPTESQRAKVVPSMQYRRRRKPPLGCQPRVIWVEHRVGELSEAIGRYADESSRMPAEWVAELSEHLNWLRSQENTDDAS